MEVLVARSDRRVSRILISILLVAVSVGILSFGYKVRHAAAPALASVEPPVAIAPSAVPDVEANVAAKIDDQPILAVNPSPATQPTLDSAPAIPAAETMLGPTTLPSADLLSDARVKLDAGDLLAARDQLNNALQSGTLSEDQAAQTKLQLSQINQTLVFSKQHFPDDPYGGVYEVKPGDSLAKIANECDTTWELLSRINGIDPKHLRAGATIKIAQGPFFAVVDKRKFTLDIYLGALPGEKSSMYVTTFPVGLGQDDSTPTGTWMVEIHRKLKHPTYYSPRGEGVIAADDPKNPLGGFWIGLTGTEGQAVGKLSYGIHGTIDPDSIGKQSSLGCIRLRTPDIAIVFDLLVEGKSLVVVKD
ncbi:MAG: LysM peptidoglycan-binding domain-containing protein [Tepidisphaeraceae bacterium]|jgi:lipoprotein-anchoring transpeptidase ErfK/SrfK